jgi:hypothetical protein
MGSRRWLYAFFAVIALVSCAGAPRRRPAPISFRPDPQRIRSAFGLGDTQVPDANRTGQIADQIWALCRGTHPVRNSLDLVFDNDHNGQIDDYELRVARGYFYGPALLGLNGADPALAARLAAPPRLGLIQEDVRIWDGYLFGRPKELLSPHAFKNAFERKLGEGEPFFDEKAIHDAVALVSRGAAEAFLQATVKPASPPVPVVGKFPAVPRGPVKTLLQALANTSGSGNVSEQEGKIADAALQTPHPVATAFDQAIDFAGTGYITMADIQDARRLGFVPSTQSKHTVSGPFPVATKADALLDIDGDGIVTEDELAVDVQALLTGTQMPPKLLAAFDTNGDGELDSGEIARALDFFRPHQVNLNNPLDVAMDVQRTGYLSPEEIGIGAGRTTKGQTLSIDDRLQALRLSARKTAAQTAPAAAGAAPASTPSAVPAPAAQRRVDIAGKKLAVVEITSATKNVGQESLDGTTTFLENAFVNVGAASIVDRGDIDKVMSELELQSSAAFASDGSTAVKVGKLAGAEIIATGTISYVGKKYYLNVKLVSVETGEVLGSSIASADSEDGFLAMCQEAAAKIF